MIWFCVCSGRRRRRARPRSRRRPITRRRRENAKPGGAKPGHEGHGRTLSEEPDGVIDHRPEDCPGCGGGSRSGPGRPSRSACTSTMDLPPMKPAVEHHRRLSVRCPSVRDEGRGASAGCGPRARRSGRALHAVATYLKTFQALSYERLQGAFAELFGLTISQGGLMNMLRRAQGSLPGRAGRRRDDAARGRGRRLGRDRGAHRGRERLSLGVLLRGGRCPSGGADPRRQRGPCHDGGASALGLAVRSLLGPAGPCGRAADLPGPSGPRCRLCARGERGWPTLAARTLAAGRSSTWRGASRRSRPPPLPGSDEPWRADLATILTAQTRCDLARDLQSKFRRACDQLLTFIAFPGAVEVDQQRLRARSAPRGRAAQSHQRLSSDVGRRGRGRCPHRGRHRTAWPGTARLQHDPERPSALEPRHRKRRAFRRNAASAHAIGSALAASHFATSVISLPPCNPQHHRG